MPFFYLVNSLVEIENCKGQRKTTQVKEIISNVFRSCILLAPNELVNIFYFFSVKLGPDYETQEKTGIGLEIISHAVAKLCGKSLKEIRD